MDPIATAFTPLLGMPSWAVQNGHGSFITLEFGAPRVEVGEVYETKVFIDGAPPRALRRPAYVRGEWHLWIYCCDWTLTLGSSELAHNESDRPTMNRALRVLNGQALVSATLDPGDASTTFTFDLGCVLTTFPEATGAYGPEPVDQWMLYEPSGDVIALLDNGVVESGEG